MSGKDGEDKKPGIIIGLGGQPASQPGQDQDDSHPELQMDPDGPDPDDPEQTSEMQPPEKPAKDTPVPEPEAPAEAEPPPLPAATPAPVTPVPRPQPSATSAATRQASTDQPPPPPPDFMDRAGAWIREWGLLCLAALLCCMLTLAVVIGVCYGAYWLISKYTGEKTAPVMAEAIKQPTPSASKPIPLPPKPKAVKPPMLVCTNYQLIEDFDGSLTTEPCDCRGKNCPERFVCQGDDYEVYLHKETIQNTDDTETTRVVAVEVDISKCQKLKK